MVKEQLELPIPRGRVRLDDAQTRGRVRLDDAPAGPAGLGEYVPGELARAAAQTLGDEIVEDLQATYPDAHLSRTPWCHEVPPPCPGWWEVTDHTTGTALERRWFNGTLWSDADRAVRSVTHAEFCGVYAWRGLVQPHPDEYPSPPYSPSEMVLRGKRLNVTVRTKYMIVTAAPRARVRL